MIIVIADDITGAAELAGIGLRYGLRVKLSADAEDHEQIDLLVIYTNTRSLQKEQAVNEMKQLAAKARRLQPKFIYKKTDSVLRGHVVAELEAQMDVLGFKKALLVPANPVLGRTIEDGRYYIKGQALNETNFSRDPEYPAKTSVVKELLAGGKTGVSVQGAGNQLLPGVNVGATKTEEDFRQWAAYQNQDLTLAGGGFFFDVLLATNNVRHNKQLEENLQYPVLFVIGTAFRKNESTLSQNENVVSAMPQDLFSDERMDQERIDQWSKEIIAKIKKENSAVIKIGNKEKGNPELLRSKLAMVVKCVVRQTTIHELIIEGGSTAFSVIDDLGWNQFTPVAELSYGVVKLKVDDEDEVFLTIKPGSYPWPSTWDLK